MPERVLILSSDVYENSLLADALRLHNVNIIGTARDVATAENLVRNLNPDLLLSVIRYGQPEILEFARDQRAQRPHLGFVFLLSCPDLRMYGITEKDLPYSSQLLLKSHMSDTTLLKEALIRAHHRASSGKEYEWFATHTHQPHKALASSLDDLTDSQMETLRLLVQGKSNAEIGRIRFVTEKSVEQMVSRIAQHLSVIAERNENLRVLITKEFFNLLSTPRFR